MAEKAPVEKTPVEKTVNEEEYQEYDELDLTVMQVADLRKFLKATSRKLREVQEEFGSPKGAAEEPEYLIKFPLWHLLLETSNRCKAVHGNKCLRGNWE